MILPQRTGNFDQKCLIQSPTTTSNSGGETAITWVNTYTGVAFEELRHTGNETFESDQQVWKRKKRIKIRRLGRTILPTMRFYVDGVNYYVTNVERFLMNRLFLVIEGEARDND